MVEQSHELPTELAPGNAVRDSLARVRSVLQRPGLAALATVDYPVDLAGSELGQLLVLLLGNVSLQGSVRLVDVTLPARLAAALELAAPGLLCCARDGALTYAWSFEDRGVWQPPKSFILQMTQRALPPERRSQGRGDRLTTPGGGMGRPPAKGQAGEQDGPRSR